MNVFSTVEGYFSPRIIGEVNDVFVKIATLRGQDVPCRAHDTEDELFYAVKGSLTMELRDRDSIDLTEGGFPVVEKETERRVYSEDEGWLMLIEKKSTQHTGDVRSHITKTIAGQKY